MHGIPLAHNTTAVTEGDPPVGRAAFRGAAIGFVLVTACMTCVGLASGLGVGGAIGLGVFVGIWGGVGFGAMLTAARCVARSDDARIAAEDQRHELEMSVDVHLSEAASDRTPA